MFGYPISFSKFHVKVNNLTPLLKKWYRLSIEPSKASPPSIVRKAEVLLLFLFSKYSSKLVVLQRLSQSLIEDSNTSIKLLQNSNGLDVILLSI